MRVVIDSNVLVAALLKDSTVREILRSPDIAFYLPETALVEIEKHMPDFMFKTAFSESELRTVLTVILQQITIVRQEDSRAHLAEAEKAMSVDIKDAPFLATALTIKADGIWSFDTDFEQQDKAKIFNIDEMLTLMRQSRRKYRAA